MMYMVQFAALQQIIVSALLIWKDNQISTFIMQTLVTQ